MCTVEKMNDRITGLPLGLFDEADYDEFRFRMKPAICLYFSATASWMPATAMASCSGGTG